MATSRSVQATTSMFRPLHAEADAPDRHAFRPDPRFNGLAAAKPGAQPDAPPPEDELANAWNEGFRAGAAETRAQMVKDEAATARLAQAFECLIKGAEEVDADKLRETVIALCGTVVDSAAIDPGQLSRRITAALALLRRSTDERVLRLHPDDLALVADQLPPALERRPDATLERGALRLETAAGGVEDGPSQWRDAIAAAVRGC